MGNNNTGNSLFLKLQHDVKKLFTFLVIECRGRLVKDQKFNLLRHCLRNFNQLLFAYTQRVNRHIHIFMLQTYSRKHLLRPLSGLCPVYNPFCRKLLIAQEHILRH